MRRSNFYFIFLLCFLVPDAAFANSTNKNTSYEIKTSFGSFSLTIPYLTLPEHDKIALVEVKKPTLPNFVDLHDPRYIPDNPSWLDQAGKFFKEGVENLFLGDLNIAAKRFKSVIDEYPETEWISQSWFWYGHTAAKKGKYLIAKESLNNFLNSIKSGNRSSNFTEFKNFAMYTLVWMELKKRKFKEALLLIKTFEPELSINKIQNRFNYLKYYTFHKLNKSSAQVSTLIEDNKKKFPFNFEYFVLLAEHYYMQKRWRDLSNFVTSNFSESPFYNDSKMEHFVWLGIASDMKLNKWQRARKKLIYLEKLGVRNHDKLTIAFFRLSLGEKNFFDAWNKWTEIEDDILREQSLKELIHYAIIFEDYKFLQSKLNSLKNVSRYWENWQEEMELIYAYLFLKLGYIKKSNQWLEWSIKHSLRKEKNKNLLIVLEESLFLRSIIQLISFEYKKAFHSLKNLLEEYPSSMRLSDYYFWYGLTLYEIEKKYLEAIMAIRQVEQEGERDDDRLYLLGKINHDQKKWRLAIFSFSSLKKKYPNSRFIEESLYLQSEAYYKQKRYNLGLQALDELETKYKTLKNPVRTIILKVRLLIALKKFEQADEVLRRRIAVQPDLSLIRLRVEVLKNIKDPERILSVTGQGIGISTSEDEGFLFFHRANALYDVEKYQEADAYYNLAKKNPPENTERLINFRIMKIQYVLGRIPELLRDLEKFLEVNNEDDYSNEILFLVGNYFIEKNEKEKAVPYFNQLIKNYKKSVSLVDLEPKKRVEQIFLIGKLYSGISEFKMSERWLNQALRSIESIKEGRKDLQLSILKEKGEVLFNLGKHRQALAASLKVLYLDQKMTERQLYDLNLRIASSYVFLNRTTEAQAIYRKMLKKIRNKDKRIIVEKLLKKLSK